MPRGGGPAGLRRSASFSVEKRPGIARIGRVLHFSNHNGRSEWPIEAIFRHTSPLALLSVEEG
jgi:hypothetical protein